MNITKLTTIFIFLTLICGQTIADGWKTKKKKYSCITQASGGVTYSDKSKSWIGAKFLVSTKYVVDIDHSRTGDVEQLVARIYETPNDYPTFSCTYRDSSDSLYHCEGFGGVFKFNEKTLRFRFTSLVGYLNGGNDKNYSPHIVIGTCNLL